MFGVSLSHLQIDCGYFSASLWDLDRLEQTLGQIAVLPKLQSLVLDWSRLGDHWRIVNSDTSQITPNID